MADNSNMEGERKRLWSAPLKRHVLGKADQDVVLGRRPLTAVPPLLRDPQLDKPDEMTASAYLQAHKIEKLIQVHSHSKHNYSL